MYSVSKSRIPLQFSVQPSVCYQLIFTKKNTVMGAPKLDLFLALLFVFKLEIVFFNIFFNALIPRRSVKCKKLKKVKSMTIHTVIFSASHQLHFSNSKNNVFPALSENRNCSKNAFGTAEKRIDIKNVKVFLKIPLIVQCRTVAMQ